jgi:hypothetical protein
MTGATAGRTASHERLEAILGSIDITPFQKGLLRERWLDQVAWMGAKARATRRRYLVFRLPVVVGGVLIPALITILLSTPPGTTNIGWLAGMSVDGVRFLAFTVSLLVAACAGIEEVLKFGDRWRHYRRTAELLKTVGWQYLMLNGGFRHYKTHAAAFTAFTERVEDTLNEDVEGYLGTMAGDRTEGGGRHEVIA